MTNSSLGLADKLQKAVNRRNLQRQKLNSAPRKSMEAKQQERLLEALDASVVTLRIAFDASRKKPNGKVVRPKAFKPSDSSPSNGWDRFE